MLKIKSRFIITMVTVFSIFLLSNCNKPENSQSNNSSIEYIKVQGYKHVFANNIENKVVLKAQNGVICFFNVDDYETTYSNAITFIPSKRSDISKINKFLSNKELSFDYELNHMLVNSKNSTLIFVVDNEDGIQYINKYSGDNEIIHLLQMSFMKRNNFLLKDSDNNMSVNDYIKHVVSNYKTVPGGGNSDCTAGGPGSTSCQVGDVWSSCSVSCSAGYYACCHGSDNTCECIKEGAAINK